MKSLKGLVLILLIGALTIPNSISAGTFIPKTFYKGYIKDPEKNQMNEVVYERYGQVFSSDVDEIIVKEPNGETTYFEDQNLDGKVEEYSIDKNNNGFMDKIFYSSNPVNRLIMNEVQIKFDYYKNEIQKQELKKSKE